MIALIGYYWYALLIAFGFGLITAWWTWAQLAVPVPIAFDPDDELIDWGRPPPPAAPVVRADGEMADDAESTDQSEAPEPAEEAAAEADAPVEAGHVESGRAIGSAEAAAPVGPVDEPVFASADELGPAIAAAQAVERPGPAALPAEDQAEAPETRDGDAEADAMIGKAPDDLMVIKGIGPQLDALLRSLGVQRFEEIAGWMPEDIERIDGQLGIFKGRILRDEWIGQARLLAKGDMESFHQRYGHLS